MEIFIRLPLVPAGGATITFDSSSEQATHNHVRFLRENLADLKAVVDAALDAVATNPNT